MKLVLPVVAVATMLAFVGSAYGAYRPELSVHSNRALGVEVDVAIFLDRLQLDDATGVVTLYSPRGYRANLRHPVGTRLGTFEGGIEVRGGFAPVDGTVRTDNPANYVGNSCAPGPHHAVWILEFAFFGDTFRLPMYVDVVTTGPEAAYASARMALCLKSPDVPPPQGWPREMSLRQVALFVNDVFTNPVRQGTFQWNAVFVPYTTGTATLNPSLTTQSTSYMRLPVHFALTAKRQQRGKRSFAIVTACLREAGHAVRRVRVNVYYGGATASSSRKVASLRPNALGCATTRIRLRRRVVVFASANIPSRPASGCTPKLAPRCSQPVIVGRDLVRAVRVPR